MEIKIEREREREREGNRVIEEGLGCEVRYMKRAHTPVKCLL